MKGWRTVGDVTAGSVRRYIWTQQVRPRNFSGGRKSERMKHGWALAYGRIGFEHRCHVDMLKLCLLCSAQSLQIPSLQWRLEMPCKPWPPTALQLRLWLHFFPYRPALSQAPRYTGFMMSSKDWSGHTGTQADHETRFKQRPLKHCKHVLLWLLFLLLLLTSPLFCSAGDRARTLTNKFILSRDF